MIASTWPMPQTENVSNNTQKDSNDQQIFDSSQENFIKIKVQDFINNHFTVQQLKTIASPHGVVLQSFQTPNLDGLTETQIAEFSATFLKLIISNEDFKQSFPSEIFNQIKNEIDSHSIETLTKKISNKIVYDPQGEVPFPINGDDDFF